MTYTVRFSPFLNKFYVYNNITRETQSFWRTQLEACKVARSLDQKEE